MSSSLQDAIAPLDTPLRAFQAVRGHSDHLAHALAAEDQVVQSMPDASPVKWHRAHTT